MKKCILIITACSAAALAIGQRLPKPHEWRATLRVVDDTDQPIAGARAWVSYGVPKQDESLDPFQPNQWAIAGLSDTNGVFIASHRDFSSYIGFHAEKAGYYPTASQSFLGWVTTNGSPDRDVTQQLVLLRIGSRVPMYAKHVGNGPPVFNKPIGYDLTVGDWVSPYGKGKTTDILFDGELNEEGKNEFDYKLVVSFPDSGDGIQETIVERDEQRPLLFQAPIDGYLPKVVKTMSRHPGKGTVSDMNDPKRKYFFRVRSTLDERGNVKSAMYGKIYGDFMQFAYYLNPTPNDRNLEFDPTQNLFPGQNITTP